MVHRAQIKGGISVSRDRVTVCGNTRLINSIKFCKYVLLGGHRMSHCPNKPNIDVHRIQCTYTRLYINILLLHISSHISSQFKCRLSG